jgi:hypothetical protein
MNLRLTEHWPDACPDTRGWQDAALAGALAGWGLC